MRTTLPALIILVGCVPRYAPPSLDEPHATLKVRLVYHSAPGPQLSERIRLGEHGIVIPPTIARRPPGTTGTFHTRIRPEPARFRTAASFFHMTTQRVQRMRTERYACGTSTTGYGNTRTTSTRYCSRQVTDWVTQTVQVSDGHCETGTALQPQAGATYILQYDFFAAGQCTLRVLQEHTDPSGAVQLVPVGY